MRNLALLLLFAVPVQCSETEKVKYYSTCSEYMYMLNDGYVSVDPASLLKFSKTRVQPKKPELCNCTGPVHVKMFIKRDRPFCATAMDGDPVLQKLAVKAALQWRFTKKRQEFEDNIYGTITFTFDK